MTEHSFIIKVSLKEDATFMYERFRSVIQAAVNAVPYLSFVSINETVIPDHYSLSNPDDVPEGFM